MFELAPPVPGVTLPSSGSFSPGTATRLEKLDCSSLEEAQEEIKKAIAKNEATGRATRLIMGNEPNQGEV